MPFVRKRQYTASQFVENNLKVGSFTAFAESVSLNVKMHGACMKEVVFRLGFEVRGIQVNSYALIERDPIKALLPRAWQLFFDLYYPAADSGSSSYAVYHYPNPAQPEHFEVCIGTTSALKSTEYLHALKAGRVASGRYMFFTAEGSFPGVVQQLWQEVEQYFQAPDCPYQRAYSTDFEEVLPNGQLIIGVSVNR